MTQPPAASTPIAHPPSPIRTAVVRSTRSELVRVFRPSLVLVGLGLGAVFAVLTTLVTFLTAEPAASNGAGSAAPTSFASIETLEAAGGFLGSFELLGRLLGLVVLAVWALSVSADYDSGYIRVLVQAQPRRRALFFGKLGAVVCLTSAITLVATVVTVLTAVPAAAPADIATANWSTDVISNLFGGYLNLTLSSMAWGSIGLLIAMITRSSGLAIGIGVGWLLLLEPVIALASSNVADHLPGGTIGAVAIGGTESVSWLAALALTALYAGVSVLVAGSIFERRDITD